MIGHFKPAAGNDRGVVMRPEMVIEPLRVAAGPLRESGDPMSSRFTLEIASALDEVVEQIAIASQHRRNVANHLVEAVERDTGQPFRGMRLVDGEQVI